MPSNGRLAPDQEMILHTAQLLTDDSAGIVEMRAIDVPGQGTVSGYFDTDHLPNLVNCAKQLAGKAPAVYVTLNPVRPDLLARAANRTAARVRHTTSDPDILCRHWLGVDVDAPRPAGICSSETEKEAARARAREIRKFLLAQGFPEPIAGDSGNGYHLLYRVDLPADDQGLVGRVLQALAFRFDDGAAQVDVKNGNPARIWKLYGTPVRKGSDVPERPHRLSRLLHVPESLEIVPLEALDRVAAMLPPPPPAPARGRRNTSEFDLRAWMSERCPEAAGPLPWQNGSRWVFPECPWNQQHTNRSAYVLEFPSGAIAAGCHHNGCAGNDWHALRQLREPGWTPYEPKRDSLRVAPSPQAPQNAAIEVRAEAPRFHLSDLGNAERLVYRHGRDFRYCFKWRKWICWDGQRWAIDETGEAERRCAETVRSIYAEAQDAADPDFRKKLAAWALTCESGPHINKALEFARSLDGIPVAPEAFDVDPWLLCCQNGTVDLRTGELRPHRQADMISRVTRACYTPGATAPRWNRFLSEIFCDDAEVAAFLVRALGYALTASTVERKLFILWGPRRNGKSTLVEAVGEILGDYAKFIRSDVLMAEDSGKSNPNDLVEIPGRRFVWSSETQEGRVFNEQRIKNLTGGRDTLQARYLYGEVFDFRATFKLFLATNPKPELRGLDGALRDRLILLPFTRTFSKDPAEIALGALPMDGDLPAALFAERDGILTQLVRGCLDWQRGGLQPPLSVQAATDSYLDEVDVVTSFLEECCEVDVEDPGLFVSAKALYAAFCRKNGPKTLTQQALGRRLHEKGLRSSKGGRGSRWYGIRLLTEAEQDDPGVSDDLFGLPAYEPGCEV